MGKVYNVSSTQDTPKEPERYSKPKWYRKTERLLKAYKSLPFEIENLELQLRMDKLTGTSITPNYNFSEGRSYGISSPVESVATREICIEDQIERKTILFKMLDNTIKAFTSDERLVYQLRYEEERRDKEVYTKLQMSRSSYFELQKKVILKAARLLYIVVPRDEWPEEWKGELFEVIPWASGLKPD